MRILQQTLRHERNSYETPSKILLSMPRIGKENAANKTSQKLPPSSFHERWTNGQLAQCIRTHNQNGTPESRANRNRWLFSVRPTHLRWFDTRICYFRRPKSRWYQWSGECARRKILRKIRREIYTKIFSYILTQNESQQDQERHSVVYQHYTKLAEKPNDKCVAYECNYCNKKYAKNVTRMKLHLISCSKCPPNVQKSFKIKRHLMAKVDMSRSAVDMYESMGYGNNTEFVEVGDNQETMDFSNVLNSIRKLSKRETVSIIFFPRRFRSYLEKKNRKKLIKKKKKIKQPRKILQRILFIYVRCKIIFFVIVVFFQL